MIVETAGCGLNVLTIMKYHVQNNLSGQLNADFRIE